MRKNRDLSPIELFNALQEEWFLAYLRYRIYADKKQKLYHQKLMGYKEDKINDIANKNRLETIFSSSIENQKFRDKVFGVSGFPNIRYKNDKDRDTFEFTDKANYYMQGEDVRVSVQEGGDIIGKIERFNIVDDTVVVQESSTGNVDEYSIKIVSRIL